MEYISAQEIANRWGISKRRVQTLCANNRISNAVRIGNMWVVPTTAMKPEDARHKESIIDENPRKFNPIKVARLRIKVISENSFKTFVAAGYAATDAKNITVALFATQLLRKHCITDNDETHKEAKEAVWSLLEQANSIPEDLYSDLASEFQHFISNNPFCSDDALSWCYQYVNKGSKDSGFETTQFFTEKYMITTLVDNADILESNGKILDPACGGGNFLLYCLDLLADTHINKNDNLSDICNKVDNIVSRLYGYEIDPTLAAVASINLRIKALAVLSAHGIAVGVSDFLRIEPHVFRSNFASKLGALDCDRKNHEVVAIGTSQVRNLDDVFSDTKFLFTNPPFQTVKGMELDLKMYLKENYPSAKCDMCNAFIQLSESILTPMGRGGLVTQNSWLYLDSFIDFRRYLLMSCTIQSVIELGSNAFYDLSGEKANVALLSFLKLKPIKTASMSLFSLKNLSQLEIERILSSHSEISSYKMMSLQNEVLSNSTSRFDMVSSQHLYDILQNSTSYGDFSVPMQGTSTGNAKELLDYYWNHIGDSNWVPVSKGGGYSRWQGLNSYCVKWGKDGEFIKATPGSAIRNASYFNDTQIVFSDTGTTGLNVRVLLPDYLFVASGPGIRILHGDTFAHMAFLNSRFASYYIRLLSPKLTIAAGYIAKIPVLEEILISSTLSSNAKKCLAAKKRRLEKRPSNLEFQNLEFYDRGYSLKIHAYNWFMEDVNDEWVQLQCEQAIDEEITNIFKLSKEDMLTLESQIGIKRVYADQQDKLKVEDVKKIYPTLLDSNCLLTRTRANKSALGCDGLIEYMAQKLECSCEAVYNCIIQSNIFESQLLERYESLILHALTISVLGFEIPTSITIEELTVKIIKLCQGLNSDWETISSWLRNSFTEMHKGAFANVPIYKYNSSIDSVECIKGSVL